MTMVEADQFFLRWDNFHINLIDGFQSLFSDADLVDVTLVAEGQQIHAHKVVLSVYSSYFRDIFKANPCKHPVIILKDVNPRELRAVLQFMYHGEAMMRHGDLTPFLRIARMLNIRGLSTSNESVNNEASSPNQGVTPVAHSSGDPLYQSIRASSVPGPEPFSGSAQEDDSRTPGPPTPDPLLPSPVSSSTLVDTKDNIRETFMGNISARSLPLVENDDDDDDDDDDEEEEEEESDESDESEEEEEEDTDNKEEREKEPSQIPPPSSSKAAPTETNVTPTRRQVSQQNTEKRESRVSAAAKASQMLPCSLCERSFLHWKALRMHITMAHRRVRVPYSPNLPLKQRLLAARIKNVAPAASKVLRSQKKNFKLGPKSTSKPSKTSTGSKSNSAANSVSNNDRPRQLYSCSVCTTPFMRRFELTRHNRMFHSNDCDLPCRVCRKVFKNRHSLSSHLYHVHKERKRAKIFAAKLEG